MYIKKFTYICKEFKNEVIMNNDNISTLKKLAKNLIGEGENIQYTRGICELISDIEGYDSDTMEHADATIKIAKELGVSEENINLMY